MDGWMDVWTDALMDACVHVFFCLAMSEEEVIRKSGNVVVIFVSTHSRNLFFVDGWMDARINGKNASD